MVPVHPLVVHFPIALLCCAGVAYVASLFIRKPEVWTLGLVLHAGGVLGAIAAYVTGNNAESNLVSTHEIHELAEWHERMGMIVLWVSGMLLMWSYFRRESELKIEKAGFALLFSGLVALVVITGHLGGRMVYEKGAGVEPMKPHLEKQINEEQSKNK